LFSTADPKTYYECKVLLVGCRGVGKESILKENTTQLTDNWGRILGYQKAFITNGSNVLLQLDAVRLRSGGRGYRLSPLFRESDISILVYDAMVPRTFQYIEELLDKKNSTPFVHIKKIILVANNCELRHFHAEYHYLDQLFYKSDIVRLVIDFLSDFPDEESLHFEHPEPYEKCCEVEAKEDDAEMKRSESFGDITDVVHTFLKSDRPPFRGLPHFLKNNRKPFRPPALFGQRSGRVKGRVERPISTSEGQAFADKHNCILFHEVSARHGIGCAELLEKVANEFTTGKPTVNDDKILCCTVS